MTLADYSIVAFALFNGGRVVAYMPQIVCVYRCRNGAAAVSLLTWIMFTAANAATVTYALTVSSDLVVAGANILPKLPPVRAGICVRKGVRQSEVATAVEALRFLADARPAEAEAPGKHVTAMVGERASDSGQLNGRR